MNLGNTQTAPQQDATSLTVLLPFILLCAGCSGYSWDDSQERAVLDACRAASGGHNQTDSCCVDFVKDRMSGDTFDDLNILAHTELIQKAFLQCASSS